MTFADGTIAEWFKGRSVFVTGATGLMGKVLVYKLLMSCPDLANIFILIREKRGVDAQSRLAALLESEPFQLLKEKCPVRLSKLILVTGDTTQDNLGLSTVDKERMSKEVSVVFNVAANVKFNIPLKEAVNSNLKGPMNVIEVSKQFVKLDAFIHVSTAFCQCDQDILEERAYPVQIKPEDVIQIVDKLPEDLIEVLTPKMLGLMPNTYAFTKHLSENVVFQSGLPTGIVRPSLVTASLKDPAPGWVEGHHGATGLLIAGGKGVIRTVLLDPQTRATIIPCDTAINAMICLAKKVGSEKPSSTIFLNANTSRNNALFWGDAIEIGTRHTLTHPFTNIFWIPGGSPTTWTILHNFRLFFFQYLPAYLMDAIIFLMRQKPFLVRVQQRIRHGGEVLKYYSMKDWYFKEDLIKQLQAEMCPEDKNEFCLDTEIIDWNEYILHYILGCRQYCLKDDPSTLPRARKVLSYYITARWAFKIFFGIFVMWIIYQCFLQPHNETTIVMEPSTL